MRKSVPHLTTASTWKEVREFLEADGATFRRPGSFTPGSKVYDYHGDLVAVMPDDHPRLPGADVTDRIRSIGQAAVASRVTEEA